jgi:hypothetical protein
MPENGFVACCEAVRSFVREGGWRRGRSHLGSSQCFSWMVDTVAVLEEEGNCIVCLEMRADELMRRLISGELTNYSVVRTSPEPLQIR